MRDSHHLPSKKNLGEGVGQNLKREGNQSRDFLYNRAVRNPQPALILHVSLLIVKSLLKAVNFCCKIFILEGL